MLAAECVEIEGEDDDCVCGHQATDSEQFAYHMCVGALNLIPLPPNGSCEIICAGVQPPYDIACEAVCEELCQDNPGCFDLSDYLIDLICCDVATGTSVPWAECYNPTIHPFPANPSSQCCNDNNENSWVHGCEQCCAAQSTYGSNTWALCVQHCGTTPIQQGWCPF